MEECTCPNLNVIEEKSKELNLSQKTITKAKYLATEYFKKTIKIPTRPEVLMPSFLYIAAIITGERRTQAQLEEVFKMSSSTIRKWNTHIDKEIGDEISAEIMRSLEENMGTKDEDIKSRENEISKKNDMYDKKKIVIIHDDKDEQNLIGQIKDILDKRYESGFLKVYEVKKR